VTEAFNTKEEEYDNERLIRVVETHIDLSADALLEAIFQDVNAHVGRAEQSDDITCVIVKNH
jgi:serine phosphatase RsbU (regulator of sigma subunit)